jgi:hypothetical protein
MYNTIILSVVLYGYETWSLLSREVHRLMTFENRVLRRILNGKEMKLQELGENCIMRSSITCTLQQV